ncbi:MAG: SIS domain-containing protein [Candidatus Micrarchaeota archaeon]|nr:SIS domain-containing protein [Candidatus Micrarchaeota archaeon]
MVDPKTFKNEWAAGLSAYLGTEQVAKGRVFATGLGGSGLVGEMLKHAMNGRVVYSKTASREKFDWIIAISYSGNTWETIGVVNAMKRKGTKLLAITSGGKLAKMADRVIKLPEGMMARDAFPFILSAALAAVGAKAELKRALASVKNADLGSARGIIPKIKNKFPVIYASAGMIVAAKRFKQQLNENAKMFAFFSKMPDAFHNDTEPFFWRNDSFVPVVLGRGYPRETTARPIPKAIFIKANSDSEIGDIARTMCLLDYVSLRLTEIRKVKRDSSRRYGT